MDLLKSAELDPQLLQEIRRLHFQTRKLADQGVSGGYRSAFRGRGIEFEEVREYFPGDDIRSIDWKVTARSGRPHVKSYREERELNVLLAVDVSASTLTGTRTQLKDALIARVGAVLTLIALTNNDKVGLVTYSDQLETYHPPRKARSAVWRILHEVLTPGVYNPRTDLAGFLAFLSKVLRRRTIIFLISDFICNPYEKELAVIAKRHELTAIRVTDPIDSALPDVGLLRVQDPETGRISLIDCSNRSVASAYSDASTRWQAEFRSLMVRNGVNVLELQTDRPFIHDIRKFFASKAKGYIR